MEFNVNYVAVLVAAVVANVIGFVWYSKMLFGKSWMKLSGITEAQMKADKNKMQTYGMMFLMSLVMAYVLAHFEQVGGAADMVMGATIAFWAWLGFVATTMFGTNLFDKKPFKLFLINSGYHLASLMAMGAVLVSM